MLAACVVTPELVVLDICSGTTFRLYIVLGRDFQHAVGNPSQATASGRVKLDDVSNCLIRKPVRMHILAAGSIAGLHELSSAGQCQTVVCVGNGSIAPDLLEFFEV